MNIENLKFNNLSNCMEPVGLPVYVFTTAKEICKAVRVKQSTGYHGKDYLRLDNGEQIYEATCWAYLDGYGEDVLNQAKKIVKTFGG
jgi:hypothetical protein